MDEYEKQVQTLESVDPLISTYRQAGQKNSAAPSGGLTLQGPGAKNIFGPVTNMRAVFGGSYLACLRRGHLQLSNTFTRGPAPEIASNDSHHILGNFVGINFRIRSLVSSLEFFAQLHFCVYTIYKYLLSTNSYIYIYIHIYIYIYIYNLINNS